MVIVIAESRWQMSGNAAYQELIIDADSVGVVEISERIRLSFGCVLETVKIVMTICRGSTTNSQLVSTL